jgi:hypothetical protein
LQVFYFHSDRILALKPTEYGHLLGMEMPSQAVTFRYFGQGLRRVSRFRALGPSLSWAVAPAYLKGRERQRRTPCLFRVFCSFDDDANKYGSVMG